MFRFNSTALFCSSGTINDDQFSSGTIHQLSRTQTVNIELNLNQENIDYLNQNTEVFKVDKPTVNIGYSYYVTNGNNERHIGLVTDGYNSIFYKIDEEKNYYLVNTPHDDSSDLNFDTGLVNRQCFAIGNVLLNSYAVSASVGGFVIATIAAEGQNLIYYTGVSGLQVPAINSSNGEQLTGLFNVPLASDQVSKFSLNQANDVIALSYKDLLLEFPNDSIFFTYLSGSNACYLQNFNLSFSVNRDTVGNLGNSYPTRQTLYPIDVELTAEAYIDKYKADKLNDLTCYNSGHNMNILVKQPCSNYLAVEYYLRGMQLESMSIDNSVGQYATVNFRWRTRVGGNLINSGNNFYMVANGGTEQYLPVEEQTVSGVDSFGNLLFVQEIIWERVLTENNFTP
jgi:hypothetical protein